MDRPGPEDLRNFLRQYNSHEAISRVCLASSYLLTMDQAYAEEEGIPLTGWGLAHIAKDILRVSSETSIRDFGLDELRRALVIFENLPEPIETADPERQPFEHYRTAVRMANLQHPFQERLFLALARTSLLLEDSMDQTARGPDIDIPAAVAEVYGLPISEIIRIGVLIVVSARARPSAIRSLAKLSRSDLPMFADELRAGSLRQFSQAFGARREDFRVACDVPVAPAQVEKYAFNELRRTPLIMIDEDRFYLPVPPFLVQAVSTGLYFSLAEHFRKDRANDFREKFGHVFEEYVGRILREGVESGQGKLEILPEISYGRGRLPPDWIVIRDHDAILIECKSSQLSVKAKASIDEAVLDESVERVFHKSVSQISDFVEFLNENPSRVPQLRDVERFYGLVVCYVPLYLANSVFREMFGATIRMPRRLEDHQFASINEFENLISLMPQVDPVDVLRRKRGDVQARQAEFGAFLSDQGYRSRLNPSLRARISELFHWTPPADW